MWSKIKSRLTWKNLRWFVGVNAFGWLMQAVLFGIFTACGIDAAQAVVSAKVTNWVVFIGQCVMKARAG